MEINQAVVVDDYAFLPKFRTNGSLCLAVVRNSGNLDIRDEIGWIDLHEIQSPNRSVAIRGSLPNECLRFEFLNRLLSTVCSVFQIPESLSRDVLFFRASDCIDMSRAGDDAEDDQTTDRISTSRSFQLPHES